MVFAAQCINLGTGERCCGLVEGAQGAAGVGSRLRPLQKAFAPQVLISCIIRSDF